MMDKPRHTQASKIHDIDINYHSLSNRLHLSYHKLLSNTAWHIYGILVFGSTFQ